MNARALFREPLADAGEIARIRALMGAALRPDLAPDARARIAALLGDPAWRAVRALPPVEGVVALVAHNIRAAGCDPAKALAATVFVALPGEAHFREAGMDLVRRRRALADLGAAARRAGIERLLLLKGAALAPRYASPALRLMTDIDVAIAEDDRARLALALDAETFAPVAPNAPHARRHRATGVAFEFTVGRTPFARDAIQRAVDAPDAGAPFAAPHDADHLRIVARHAAAHAGARIWRDFLDARLLIAGGSADADAGDDEMGALLRFVATMEGNASPPGPGPSPLFDLYEAMAFVPVPASGLKLLRRVLTEGAPVRGVLGKLRRSAPQGAGGAVAERDFGLGRVPATFGERQAFKVRMAAGLLLSGRARHYMRILRLQTAALRAAGEPFFDDWQP